MLICENNVQPNVCCLDCKAMERLSPTSTRGFGGVKYRYLHIPSNTSVILSKESNVYNYDL